MKNFSIRIKNVSIRIKQISIRVKNFSIHQNAPECFTMVQLMVAELFAGPTYGRILAIYLFVDTLISGLGTWLLGFIRNELGTYIPAIHLMLAMCVTAFVCVTILNKLTKKLAVASEAL